MQKYIETFRMQRAALPKREEAARIYRHRCLVGRFNETFSFNCINENTADVTLRDEDTMSRDDHLGSN